MQVLGKNTIASSFKDLWNPKLISFLKIRFEESFGSAKTVVKLVTKGAKQWSNSSGEP